MIDLRKHITMNTQNRNGSVLLKVLIAVGIVLLIFAFMSPGIRNTSEVRRRVSFHNNLRLLTFALHNYHDTYGSFPPAYTMDEQGNRLHSWRTLILPYLEEKELYDAIDLTKPWDDPANAFALRKPILSYQSLSPETELHETTILGIAVKGGIFSTSNPVSLDQVTDDHARTLIAIEVPLEYAVPWMQPTDADENILKSISPEANFAFRGMVHTLLVNGSCYNIGLNQSTNTILQMATYAGGEESEND